MTASEAARMADSIRAYWGAYAQAGPRHYETDGDAALVWTGIPHPIMNAVILEQHDPEVTARMIDRVSGLVAASGIGACWHVAPEAATAGALDALRAVCPGGGATVPAMIAPLQVLPGPELPEGLEIVEKHGRDGRRDWAALAAEGFSFNATCIAAMADCEADIPEEILGGHVRYVGLYRGKPVAVSSLVMAGGFAGIYAVATLPEARGKGIGAAMTAHAMREGKKRGAREAALQASEMGYPVYRRLGFRTAFAYLRFDQPVPE